MRTSPKHSQCGPPNIRNMTMIPQTPTSPGSTTLWSAATEYFVPPLVIPVAVVLAVVLFVLIHGPVA